MRDLMKIYKNTNEVFGADFVDENGMVIYTVTLSLGDSTINSVSIQDRNNKMMDLNLGFINQSLNLGRYSIESTTDYIVFTDNSKKISVDINRNCQVSGFPNQYIMFSTEHHWHRESLDSNEDWRTITIPLRK